MKYNTVALAEFIKTGEATIKTGPFGTQLKASEYVEQGTPVLNVKNLGYASVVSNKLDRVGPSTLQRLDAHILRNGDIVFGRKGAVDRHAYISATEDGWMQGSDCIRLRVSSKRLNSRFLSYYFLTKFHRSFMISMCSHGTTMASLNQKILEKIEIPLPERITQDRIVNVLSSLDNKIELNQKINENLERQVFALFDKLIAGNHNEECIVSDIAILNPKRSLAKNKPARCIDMTRLPTSGAFPTGWETKPFNGGMKFSNGDTLLARITPCLENGKTAFIDFLEDGEVAFGSTEYIVLSPKEGIPPEFLYCLARNPAFVDYAVKNMNGSSGRQRVSAETIGQYCLPRLSNEDFADFGEVVAPLFLKMRYNSLENLRLAAIRDTLLPKLMAEEIDFYT